MIKQKEYNVDILTPCFCKIGNNEPEIRGASIRGMIREWKRLLWGNPDKIWGGKGGNASKIGIDLKEIYTTESKHQLLPHKGGTRPMALDEGGTFKLVINRLVGCSEQMWHEAIKDVENWLVLGCLGQRSNRAAGSVWCDDIGVDSQAKLKSYVNQLQGEFYISSHFNNAFIARETASDTTQNMRLFGSFKPRRKPSPIKMKVIKFSQSDYRILFFSQQSGLISQAEKELKGKGDNHRWHNIDFIKL